MRYYPAFLDLRNRRCLLIGQGPLADEKARLLERAGAQVLRSDRFEPETAREAFLIVAVIEDPEVAKEVKEFCDMHRIFLNVVDQPEHCSFIAPAIVDRGNLLIAVSTSGKSPAMASKIRRQLEEAFSHEYSDLLEALAEIRTEVKERLHSFDERKRFYHRLLDMDLIETLREGGMDALRIRIRGQLAETISEGQP